jgi:hypothetical protein
MNGILDWGDKQTEYATHILNGNYQRVDTEALKNEKLKQPEAAITIHTIQPYGKIMRDEESDVPYTEDSDMEVEASKYHFRGLHNIIMFSFTKVFTSLINKLFNLH